MLHSLARNLNPTPPLGTLQNKMLGIFMFRRADSSLLGSRENYEPCTATQKYLRDTDSNDFQLSSTSALHWRQYAQSLPSNTISYRSNTSCIGFNSLMALAARLLMVEDS